MTIERLLIIPYFFMIAVGLMVPSDAQHGILSIKSLAFLTAMGGLGLYASMRQKFNLSQFKLLCFAFAAMAMLLFWMMVSLMREQPGTAQFDQFKLFLITLAVPLTTLYLIQEKLITPQQLLKTVIYASFLYATLKVLLVALHLLHVINAWKIINTLGIRYMRMGIYGGLERVQTSVDIATPFLLFFLLQSKRLGVSFSRPFRYSFIILSLLSTFLSFSRYLIFIYMAGCFLYWFTLGSRRIAKVAVAMLCLTIMAIFAIGPEKVYKVVEKRVFSKNSFHSDETRVKQAHALIQTYEEAPFFGKGLGGYVPYLIRDRILRHSYEVQWAAFLMQFGFFGLVLLFAPLVFIAWQFIGNSLSRVRLSFLGAFLLWLLSGFTNPFLISLTSGIIYTLFYISSQIFAQNASLEYSSCRSPSSKRLNSSVGRAAHS